MPEVIVVDDDTPHAELALALQARTCRLMAMRDRLGVAWNTRGERARLLGEIDDTLDLYLSARG